MKSALVCIAKNEDLYIEEWITYNLKLGFDHIFIFENDWRCKYESQSVTKIPFNGHAKQREAYNYFIQNYSEIYDWSAFFDVDEFLVLKKHGNVNSFISEFRDFNGIGINWCFFGSNGHDRCIGNYSVLQRFTRRRITPLEPEPLDHHVKTILKLDTKFIMDIHNPNVELVDTNKVPFMGPLNSKVNTNIAQLNHYFTKSKEEFQLKAARGRADNGEIRSLADFEAHDFNDIEDMSAFMFMNEIRFI